MGKEKEGRVGLSFEDPDSTFLIDTSSEIRGLLLKDLPDSSSHCLGILSLRNLYLDLLDILLLFPIEKELIDYPFTQTTKLGTLTKDRSLIGLFNKLVLRHIFTSTNKSRQEKYKSLTMYPELVLRVK